MSVYTPINHQQLEQFLQQYTLGSLIRFSGIQAGIENTNYRVSTSTGEYILTLFESLAELELPVYLSLIKHLNESGFPAPKPYCCKENRYINNLAGKPATVFSCLSGQSIDSPSPNQCSEIGGYLAKLHQLSSSTDFYQENSKNISGCQKIFNQIKAQLSETDIQLLNAELNYQSHYPLPNLPHGIIHADLFKDNVLFEQGRISAILDFYNACSDCFLYDIAVTCNDWCVVNESLDQQKFKAFISGYQMIRPLTEDERIYLTVFFRLAALRFWLSRIQHQLSPKQGELTLEKDPLVFKRLLQYYRTETINL